MNTVKNGSDSAHIFWRIEEWFPELPEHVRVGLKTYHSELLKFNKNLSLVGVKTVPMADAIHFADSILASRVIEKDLNCQEIFEFGAGNGFPGVVLALLLPQVKVRLVVGDVKKAEFLKHLLQTLNLKNASVMAQSVESLPPGSVQCAVSRGFAGLAKSILISRKVFALGGKYYHLKGEEWATEIADIPTQLCSFWMPSLLAEYKLPVGQVRFAVVKTEKIQD